MKIWDLFRPVDSPLLYGAQLTIAAESSKDRARKRNNFIEVRLRLPLWPTFNEKPVIATGLRRRLMDRIQRDVDIISSNEIATDAKLFDPLRLLGNTSGDPNNIYWVDFSASTNGDGSYASPFNQLPTNIDPVPSAPGAIMVIKPGGNWNTGAVALNENIVGFINVNSLLLPSDLRVGVRRPDGKVFGTGRPTITATDTLQVIFPDRATSVLWDGIDFTDTDGFGLMFNADSVTKNIDFTYQNTNINNVSGGIVLLSLRVNNCSSPTITGNVNNVTLSTTAAPSQAFRVYTNPAPSAPGTIVVNVQNFTTVGGYTANSMTYSDGLNPAASTWQVNLNGNLNLSSLPTFDVDTFAFAVGGTYAIDVYDTYGPNVFKDGSNIMTDNMNVNWPAITYHY